LSFHKQNDIHTNIAKGTDSNLVDYSWDLWGNVDCLFRWVGACQCHIIIRGWSCDHPYWESGKQALNQYIPEIVNIAQFPVCSAQQWNWYASESQNTNQNNLALCELQTDWVRLYELICKRQFEDTLVNTHISHPQQPSLKNELGVQNEALFHFRYQSIFIPAIILIWLIQSGVPNRQWIVNYRKEMYDGICTCISLNIHCIPITEDRRLDCIRII